MNKLLKLGVFAFLLIGFACQNKIQEDLMLPDENSNENSNIRMPFSQKVYLINNVGNNANLYQVNYDFQGLTDTDAELDFKKSFEGRSHMTVSPDGQTVVVVNNGGNRNSNGLIHFWRDGQTKTFFLRKGNNSGGTSDKKVKITQVDFDRKGRLFIAGGFYQVVPSDDNGTPLTGDVAWWDWNNLDNLENSRTYNGETYPTLTTVNYLRENAEDLISSIDEDDFDLDDAAYNDGLINDYFGDVDMTENSYQLFESQKNRPLKFKGGDITFTQNNQETGGFEEEHLITFTRAYGGAAIKVSVGEKNGKPAVQGSYLFSIDKKVTGAALMGDNHVIVSTARQNTFKIYSLDGAMVVNPTITFSSNTPADKTFTRTSAGDMACTQVFDIAGESGTDGLVTDRVIRNPGGANDEAWYHEYWNLAEMKLYRPNYPSEIQPDDMPNVSVDQRQNSANADIADLRQNPKLFTSLGGDGGYAVMKFRAPTVVTNSTHIQVVETTWGRSADYGYINDDGSTNQAAVAQAASSYNEKANVWVWVTSGDQPKYINNSWVTQTGSSANGEWVLLGEARITNNVFPLGQLAMTNDKLSLGDVIQWVKIEAFGSQPGDYFDINYVSAYSDYCEDYGIGSFDNIVNNQLFVSTYLESYSYADRLDGNNHEGQVSFTNNPKSVHNGFMDEDFGDNVMVVNAAQDDNSNRNSHNNPGLADMSRTFFKDYIPVLAGETYYFSADVINVIRGKDLNNPHLDMYIGYNIGFANEGTVSLPQVLDLTESDDWTQMYLEFTAPANGIITIGIAEVSDAWNGNDFAIDNIAFSCTPPTITRATPCVEVINIDFENDDDQFSTDYRFVTDSNPDKTNELHPEGTYAITSTPENYHHLFTNHENSSNAMIINGSTTADLVAFSTTVNVVEGQNYTLTFRVADINVSGSDADVPLTISASVFESNHIVANVTGEIDDAWQTVTLCWTSEMTGQDEITIVCDNTRAGGNDFGLDDIKVSRDCPDCQ